MADQPTLELISRFRADKSSSAADELFRRYSERVLAFLRPRLNARLASRIEPDDVAQSVFNSFFRGLAEHGFVFRQREDVWRLLVQIALHKLHNQSRRHRAARRNVDRESNDLLIAAVAREPSPAEAAAVYDELEACLRARHARDRNIVEQFVCGNSYEEIALRVQWSQRTVRRVCEQMMNDLQRRLAVEADPKESHP
ncbi:MAG TPA: sigma-70 family RNA polymerase sigma factor [Gemmataceae bacterium]|nr:sigma-70 family RNA polymerase sigma factor [Gemmataceae bacterium]